MSHPLCLLPLLLLLLDATMGLGPHQYNPHRHQQQPSQHSNMQQVVQRKALSVVVAAALVTATVPLEVHATLTSNDLQSIQEIVINAVTASEARTNTKLEEMEKKQDIRFKENDVRFEQINNSIKEQANMFVVVPLLSTSISGAIAASASYASNKNSYTSNKKLDNTIAQFKSEKGAIMKDLEAGTQAKSFQGVVAGLVVGVPLITALAKFVNGI